jgi:hypothetical protein
MNRIRIGLSFLAALFFFYSGCDTGLEPPTGESGFSGVIRFTNWPPADSVRELRVVAFEEYPTDSSGIISALLSGRAAVYPSDLSSKGSLPKFVDTVSYTFNTKNGINLQVQEYAYVVVAQQYGPNIFTDWRPAGVYTTQPNSFEPALVRVLLHRIATNIDIQVDFHNPPPKPW